MAKILNIETSTTVCSIAIGVDGETVSVHEINDGYSHAEEIEGLIEKSLKESKLTFKDLDAISVSKGPGSYTGLRIGVSLAKGLCFGLEIPLISVPTLEAMAFHPKVLENRTALRVPMLDARRMEVYSCVLSASNQVVSETEAVVIDENSYHTFLRNNEVLFFGPGMEKCKEQLAIHNGARFQDEVLPSAKQMVMISDEKFNAKQFEDVAYFEPFYLKDFVAGKPKKLL
jgi:tRNA threonylcarbamoyladenosine biosynthesis protein TsaB